MPNYRQLLETAGASLTLTNVLAALGITALFGSGLFIHDLYQRYKNYVVKADQSADFLLTGGILSPGNNAAINIEDQLETLRQMTEIRNDRQDDTRAKLTFLGRFFSRFLREGHSNIDDIIARNINNIALVPGYATDEEIEIALQRAILGGTRTRGYLTTLARRIGGPIYRLLG
jgi:hypothetical protein